MKKVIKEVSIKKVNNAIDKEENTCIEEDNILHRTEKYMRSKDYRTRFAAEYWQTFIRYKRLRRLLSKYDSHTLDFKPTCSIRILRKQEKAMNNYLYCLEVRARVEHIDLSIY